MSVHDKAEALQQYLTFCLGDEIFAVDVAQVREILDQIQITRVPQMPEFMLGVINLRGSVVPVVDLRRKFGMASVAANRDNCIVVMEVDFGGELTVVGALADAVQEVLDLGADQIEPPPRLGTKLKTEFIHGMGKKGEQFVILLNIDKIFSSDELHVLHGSANESAA
jgi:purine-binding chemotaxis protein CheW